MNEIQASVYTSSAGSKGGWGRYCNIFVVVGPAGETPRRVDDDRFLVDRAWRKVHQGDRYPAGRCEASRAYAEALALCDQLNGEIAQNADWVVEWWEEFQLRDGGL